MQVIINKTQTSQQPLIYLEDINVAIYHDKIIQFHNKKPTSSTHIDPTVPSISDIQNNDKILSFLKNDIAFKIIEKQKQIQIIQILKYSCLLQFNVKKQSQFIIIQQILRKKLCQIGFHEKYTIKSQLGKGATAKVYLVQRKSDYRLFAAKIISLKDSDNKQYDSFINQTKILKYLKSPYVVSIQSLYVSKKQLICVLEYLNGGTLLQQLKNDRVSTTKLKWKVVKDLTQGIEHLRQKRIVHRDLKLQNIMVRINSNNSKDYVLTDFGLAAWIGQSVLLYQKCGTPGYIAPQVLREQKNKVILAHSLDIFSLGVIFHYIFLLRGIFNIFGNTRQLLKANKQANFSLNTQLYNKLLAIQRIILIKTLTIQPSQRITSRQLLDQYINQYQRVAESRQNKHSGRQQKIKQNKISNRLSSSIQVVQKKAVSVDRKNEFTNKIKQQKSIKKLSTQIKEKQQEKLKQNKKQNRSDSLVNKIRDYFSTPKPKLKQKQQKSNKKQQMKKYI